MVSRRMAIAGGAGALVLGALGYRAWDRGVFQGASGPAYDAWDEWRGFDSDGPKRPLRAAILAASPHNTQPWLFEARDNAITIYADRARHLGTFDPFRREMHIGLGCAIENLCLAAGAHGFTADVAIARGRFALSPGPKPIAAAQITLTRGDVARDPLCDVIPRRRTNRGAYLNEKSPDTTQVFLVERRDGEPGTPAYAQLAFVSDPIARKELGAVIVDATKEITADPQMSADSFRYIRTGRRDVEAHRDGIVIDNSGVSPFTVIAGKMAPDLGRETTDRTWLDMTRETHVATAPVFGIVLVRDRLDMAETIAVGRTWQRMQLKLTAGGLAAQPLNQPVEMVDRNAMLGRNDTYKSALAKLAKAEPGWEATFVFRMGYAEREAKPSPRRRLEDVIKA